MEDDRLRHLLHQPCGCMCTKRLVIPTEVLFTDSRGTMVAERGRSVYGPRPTKDASKQNETGSKHCTALEHTAWRSRAVARTGDSEAWDWPGRNIGVNKHGVTKECQCPGVNAGIQNGLWLEIWICAVPMSSANDCNCQSLSGQQAEGEKNQRHVQSKGKRGHLTRLVCPPLPLSLGRCQGRSSK